MQGPQFVHHVLRNHVVPGEFEPVSNRVGLQEEYLEYPGPVEFPAYDDPPLGPRPPGPDIR